MILPAGAVDHRPTPGSSSTTAPLERDSAGPPVAVIGIGASAGGLKAITAFLAALPGASGLAVAIVQHRSPNNERLMVDLLAKATAVPVLGAKDGDEIASDHVYVMPAGCIPGVANGHFTITDPDIVGTALPIDIFFRSLAVDRQQGAICVVLSGSGADGTIGLKAVKESGGLVVVQDPATAAYDGMPRSAIATGLVDYVLAPEQMPAAIVRFAQQPYVRDGGEPKTANSDNDRDLDRILSLMQARTRYDYRAYKTRTLARRIERRMGIHHIGELRSYLDYLGKNPGEVEQLTRDILISVTRFFRDPEAFAELAEQVITPLVRNRPADRPVRVWVAGCATGEEVYSIAMLLVEACESLSKPLEIKVFGTDLDAHSLDVARAGIYPDTIAVDVSPARLGRFFTKIDAGYKVNRQLRESVSFAVQNVISDPPFSSLDLISCRNMLIYIEPTVQHSILNLFHFGLVDGGCLLLGSAETIGSQTDLFEPLSKKWRLYRKLGTGRRKSVALPAFGHGGHGGAPVPAIASRIGPAEITRQALLFAYAPAAVLIDQRLRILYLYGPTGDFLDLPTGEPPQDLLTMMRGDLRLKVRGAVEQAVASNRPVTIGAVRLSRPGAQATVSITVTPVRTPRTADDLLLVTFVADTTEPPARITGTAADMTGVPDATEAAVLDQLENELRITREDLNATIQELEGSNEALRAANEEILSVNEELQSSNEELETSKEELQSLNEELGTVNAQLHEKVDELETATDDLTNLLSSTDIATLFLSPDLRIKRFTPAATRLFALIPTDVGRPITDISRRFTDPDLVADVRQVNANLTPMEREVETDHGLTLLRRVHPYRTRGQRIEGAVITFSDVTALKRTAAILAARARQQRLVADLGRTALAGEAPRILLETGCRLTGEMLGADCVGILAPSDTGRGLVLVDGFGCDRAVDRPAVAEVDPATLVGRVFHSRQPALVADFAAEGLRPGGPPIAPPEAASGIAVAFGDAAKPPSILALFSSRSRSFDRDDLEFVQAVGNVLGLAMERAATLEAMKAARDFAEAIVDTVREPLLVLDQALHVVGASRAYHRMFGTTPEGTLRQPLSALADGIFREPALLENVRTVVADGTPMEEWEILSGAGGPGPRTLRLNARRLNHSDRQVLLGIEDVTLEKRASEALATAKVAAEHAIAGKTRFLAAASHDLRQPVQAAVLFHHLLSEKGMGDTAVPLMQNLGSTLEALRSMLDEILHVSRLDAGVVEVKPQAFALQPLLGHLADEFAPLARSTGLTLRSVRTSLSVRSDPALLSRILQNFVANAIKYTEHGRILVGCRPRGGTVRIQVWDTGRGIPESQIAAIFEEFHQVDNPGRDRSRGLGLGLAIVERLAKLLGHPIGVRSVPGKGSVFEIVIPTAATAGVEAPAVAPPAPPTVGRGRHVLVIDDDPVLLNAIQLFIAGRGFAVSGASDFDSAIAEVSEQRAPDLVVADYRLQGDDTGSAVIKRLSAALGTALPGIILTGDTSPDRIRDVRASGFVLLHKPVSPDDLLAAIASVLGQGRDG